LEKIRLRYTNDGKNMWLSVDPITVKTDRFGVKLETGIVLSTENAWGRTAKEIVFSLEEWQQAKSQVDEIIKEIKEDKHE